mmetsp:Transcript_121995/g.350525  ORF Transcript_121995/g.350525 Transcript_121995/m.350525 type:complete len:91 (-) Transcript_121995:40-312(-)
MGRTVVRWKDGAQDEANAALRNGTAHHSMPGGQLRGKESAALQARGERLRADASDSSLSESSAEEVASSSSPKSQEFAIAQRKRAPRGGN